MTPTGSGAHGLAPVPSNTGGVLMDSDKSVGNQAGGDCPSDTAGRAGHNRSIALI
jgi:hypothetical protein